MYTLICIYTYYISENHTLLKAQMMHTNLTKSFIDKTHFINLYISRVSDFRDLIKLLFTPYYQYRISSAR